MINNDNGSNEIFYYYIIISRQEKIMVILFGTFKISGLSQKKKEKRIKRGHRIDIIDLYKKFRFCD